MPHATSTLTAPGELHTAAIGRITLTAQLTVDGGVTITAWTGPNRHHAVTWTYTDRQLARTRYAQIRQLAATGLTAQQIADQFGADRDHAVQAVRGILSEAMQSATADDSNGSNQLVAALQQTAADLESDAERSELAVLAADVADAMRAAAQPTPATDPAVDYLAGVTAARHAAIDDAVRAAELLALADTVGQTVAAGVTDADRPRTLADYVGEPDRANACRLAHRTPRRLSERMLDMLADAAARPEGLRLDNKATQNRARAIAQRGGYLELEYLTPGVHTSLRRAHITGLGRRELERHRPVKAEA